MPSKGFSGMRPSLSVKVCRANSAGEFSAFWMEMVNETGPLMAHSISSGQRSSLEMAMSFKVRSVPSMAADWPGRRINSSLTEAVIGGGGGAAWHEVTTIKRRMIRVMRLLLMPVFTIKLLYIGLQHIEVYIQYGSISEKQNCNDPVGVEFFRW